MSLVHLRLVRIQDEERFADYRVESPDLGNSKEWEYLGGVKIDKCNKSYDFSPSSLWLEKKGIPPSVYSLDKEKQKEVLTANYPNHGWGAWAMIIHHYATHFLTKALYPEEYPATFFRGRT